MARTVTTRCLDAVASIEAVAERFTGGNKTEAVALALRCLQGGGVRTGSLFGAHKGSVIVRNGVNLIAPVLQDAMDAETGYEPWTAAGRGPQP